MLSSLSKYRDEALLMLRVGLGTMFILHGLPLLMAGPTLWQKLAMSVGLVFLPSFWGLLAALAESVGGLMLVLGLAFRPALALLMFTMAAALNSHLRGHDPFVAYSRPIEMLIVFAAMFILGPGKHSVDRK